MILLSLFKSKKSVLVAALLNSHLFLLDIFLLGLSESLNLNFLFDYSLSDFIYKGDSFWDFMGLGLISFSWIYELSEAFLRDISFLYLLGRLILNYLILEVLRSVTPTLTDFINV